MPQIDQAQQSLSTRMDHHDLELNLSEVNILPIKYVFESIALGQVNIRGRVNTISMSI